MNHFLRTSGAVISQDVCEALFDPYWTHHAALTLGVDPAYERWPVRHGVWLAKRAPGLARARAQAADALISPLK